MMVIKYLNKEINNSSLIFFRIGFGLVMFFSILRFILKGWINSFYIEPIYHFNYLGFEWVKVLPESQIYTVFYIFLFISFLIIIGAFYRLSIILFFIIFTYIELIDKTYYLNHYYAISLISFLMIFLPLNSRFSIDSLLGIVKRTNKTKMFSLEILKLQISIIYFFAGIAKINYDWLIMAQPMKIWLNSIPYDFPIVLLSLAAYIMSWLGMLYDVLIAFLLRNNKILPYAFATVIIFHILTGILFNIGVFPYVMILLSTLFFKDNWFDKFINKGDYKDILLPNNSKLSIIFFSLYFFIQIIIPMRYLLYPGNILWTEDGFRFSWRVMLIEKTGMVNFILKDKNNKTWNISPSQYLTKLQEKMMSTQADMILQFAHFLKDDFKSKNIDITDIKALSYISLNGRESEYFINPNINLLSINLKTDNYKFIITNHSFVFIIIFPLLNLIF